MASPKQQPASMFSSAAFAESRGGDRRAHTLWRGLLATLAGILALMQSTAAAATTVQQPSWFSLGRETTLTEAHKAQLEYRFRRIGVTNLVGSHPEQLLPTYNGPTNVGVSLSARVLRGAVRVGDPVVFMWFIRWHGGRTNESLVATIKDWRLFDGFQEVPKHYLVQNMVPTYRHSVQPTILSAGETRSGAIPLEKVFEFNAPGVYRGTVVVRASRAVNLNRLAARQMLEATNAFDVPANDYFFRVLPKDATDAELEAAETEIEQLTAKTAAESLIPHDPRSELAKRLAGASPDQAAAAQSSGSNLPGATFGESSTPSAAKRDGILAMVTNPLSILALGLLIGIGLVVVRARRRAGRS